MAKGKHKKVGSSEMVGDGLKKAKQLLEARIEYNTLKEIAGEGGGQASQEQNPSQAYNPDVLNQYTEWLNSLPEEQRGVAMQLIGFLHQGGGSSTKMDPTGLMMMNMLGQNQGGNNDATTKMIENQNQVLVELIKNQGDNKGGESVAEIMKAVNEAKGNQENILNMLLQGFIDSSGKDDVDEKLNFLTKAKDAGLITDPQTMFEVKKLESESEREKYKADREYEIKKLEIDKDKEQTDKASEFLSDIASTIQDLSGEKEGNKDKSEGTPAQPVDLNYPCPQCNTPVTISPQTEDGAVLKCPSCEGAIKVKRKPQQEG